ncbi:MAG: cation-efflux pump [Chloroflexi bacterium]|nr:cation-efflux pump [Chloroflexota bacterium]
MATSKAPDALFAGIRRVLWLTLFLNLIPALAKLGAGFATDSLSLTAGGFDSVFDAAANIVGLVGIGIASQPADERHPYGHRKAETLTSLIISILLFVTTWELIASAYGRIRNPETISGEVTVWSFAALGVSITVQALVSWYEKRAGRRLGSDLLVADAMHTRADVLASLSVMVGLVLTRLGYPLADPIAALIVAGFIAKIGLDIIREATGTVMDQAVLPAERLEQVALSVPGVQSVHRARSHGYESEAMADLHIRVDPAMPSEQSHALAHEVVNRLRAQEPMLKDITVHVEPSHTIPSEMTQEEVALLLRRLADGLGLSVHHVWVSERNGDYSVSVHLEMDGALTLREAHALATTLEERARSEIGHVVEVTTHIEPHGGLARAKPASLPPADVSAAVVALVDGELGAGACHKVQVRDGSAGKLLSLHCYLPGELPLDEAHRVTDRLQHELYARIDGLQSVVVHAEPRPDAGETS